MKEVTHIRKGHLIYSVAGVLVKDCKTINMAKRECRLMQKEGVKDRWVVRVEAPARPSVKAKKVESWRKTNSREQRKALKQG